MSYRPSTTTIRVFWLTVITLTAVGSLMFYPGPQPGYSQNEVITFLGYLPSSQIQTVIEAFKVVYPDVDVQYTQYPLAQYADQLNAAIVSGNKPDLALVPNMDTIPTDASAGRMFPLEDFTFMPENSDITYGVHRENYSQSWINLGSVDFEDGQDPRWYGLPLSATIHSLVWYDREAGLNVPANIDEFLSDTWLSDLEAAGREPFAVGLALAEGEYPVSSASFLQALMIRQSPADLPETVEGVDPNEVQQRAWYPMGLADGQIPWNHPGVIEAWDTYRDLVNDYALPDVFGLTRINAIEQVFMENTAWMVVEDDWAALVIEGMGYIYGEDYAFFVIPGPDGAELPLQVSGDFLGVFNDQHPMGVRLFLDFLTSTDGAKAWVTSGLGLSPNLLPENLEELYDPGMVGYDLATMLRYAPEVSYSYELLLPPDMPASEYLTLVYVIEGSQPQSAISQLLAKPLPSEWRRPDEQSSEEALNGLETTSSSRLAIMCGNCGGGKRWKWVYGLRRCRLC